MVSERDIELVHDIEGRISMLCNEVSRQSFSECKGLETNYVSLFPLIVIDKKMDEFPISENKVLELLNEVTSAKRAANMVCAN